MYENSGERGSRRPGAGVVAGFVIGAAIAAAVAWLWPRFPSDASAEAGFARDMATHHDQAVEMAFLVRDVATDARLRALAYDIIVTQSAQRGMFMGWLQQWGLPQASTGPRMAWMQTHVDHGTGDEAGLMPGMASAREMQELRAAAPDAREVLFLQLMIRHHEGGVLMARALVAVSQRDEVVAMARSIDSNQAVEIALMKEMLSERGARPLPSLITGRSRP